MKLAVVCISRGNPEGMAATITALRALESGEHSVAYYVRCDDDDPETETAAHRNGIEPIVGTRYDTLGQGLNEAAAGIPRWDVFCMMADDVTPTAPNWDAMAARVISPTCDVASWAERDDPYNPTLPIISRRFWERLGYVYPEIFPFWFMDTWVAEVQMIAHGFCPVLCDLTWHGERGKSGNLRELPFWAKVFTATRPLRWRDARKLSGKIHAQAALVEREKADEWFMANAERLERQFGTGAPPDARYLRAKARAAKYMERELVD